MFLLSNIIFVQIAKKPPFSGGLHCVGIFLFFRDVTIQVSSALSSLTSVFGMGTGGPSLDVINTNYFRRFPDDFIIIAQCF